MRNGPQVHLFRRCRIGACALQERNLVIADFPYGTHCFVDLREGCHTGGEDDRFSLFGDVADEREVNIIKGGDFVSRDIYFFEEVNRWRIKRC
jgi:hypothetical protein